MSKNLSIIYQSNVQSKEWQVLEDLARNYQLTSKDDITLVKVYLILLGQQAGAKQISKLTA